MKHLLVLLAFSLSLSAFADQQKEFLHRSGCEYGRGYESKISGLEKLSETDEAANFKFVVTYSKCDNIERFQGPIKVQNKMVQVGHYGLAHPFKKRHAEVISVEALSETSVETEITISKSVLAKKSSHKFIFDCWAADYLGFAWVMEAKDHNGEMEISFEGFERL